MTKYTVAYQIHGSVTVEARNAGAAKRAFEGFTLEHLGAMGELQDVEDGDVRQGSGRIAIEPEEDWPHRKMMKAAMRAAR